MIWIVIGASRGIGLEWVKQILDRGDQVLATVRDISNASQLWALAGAAPRANCTLLECDVSSEPSIDVGQRMGQRTCIWSDVDQRFAHEVAAMKVIDRIDYVILNAGILLYPNVCPALLHLSMHFVDRVAGNRTVRLPSGSNRPCSSLRSAPSIHFQHTLRRTPSDLYSPRRNFYRLVFQ